MDAENIAVIIPVTKEKNEGRNYRRIRHTSPIYRVYENLHCKLSQIKELQAERNERAQEIKTDFRLNCDSDIAIEELPLTKLIQTNAKIPYKVFFEHVSKSNESYVLTAIKFLNISHLRQKLFSTVKMLLLAIQLTVKSFPLQEKAKLLL